MRDSLGGDKAFFLQGFPWFAIVGPTAVGKTELSLRLAERLHGEIINCDSVQIYKYLDIGSAKPTLEERKRVRHHLVDLLFPDEPFDAADFVKRAWATGVRIERRGKVPLLVGGTGFYLKSLEKGLTPLPKGNQALRIWLRNLEKVHGKGYLHRCLSGIDPCSAKRLAPKDLYRVIRALEVFCETSKTFSALCNTRPPRPLVTRPLVKIGLTRPRNELYERINARVVEMFEGGLVEEVRRLLSMGYSPLLRPLQSLGYRQAVLLIKGELSFEEAIYDTQKETRHYAKRQITWFKKDPTVKWFHPERLLHAHDLLEYIMTGKERG